MSEDHGDPAEIQNAPEDSQEAAGAQTAGAAARQAGPGACWRWLCIVLAVLALAGAGFGILGMLSASRVLKESRHIELMHKTIDDDVAAIQKLKQELTAANEQILDDIRQSLPRAIEDMQKGLGDRVQNLEQRLDESLAGFEARSTAELGRLNERVNEELRKLEEKQRNEAQDSEHDLRRTMTLFQDMSLLLESAENENQDVLTAREQQLLALLASQLDPANPSLNYAAARWAFSFGRYDRARALLDRVLETKGVEDELFRKAQTLRTEADRAGGKPVVLEHQSPGRVRVGPYGVFELHLNTLLALVKHGYLTAEEAQQILEESKKKTEAEEPSPVTIGATRYVPVP